MKMVVAIIRKEKLSDVLSALFAADVHGITVSTVQGHGGERERVQTYRGMTVKMELLEKVRLDIAVSDSWLERTVKTILSSARTGEVGDGKIFVYPIAEVVRIRTGERDESAL
jgi:nitrogen regulatory protein P-II 1